MKLYYGGQLPHLERSVVVLGMFDGCHNGHRRILAGAVAMAARMGCESVAYTYQNHPLSLLSPQNAPRKLQNDGDRVAALFAGGIDHVCLRPFTREEANTSPEDFLDRLCGRLGMRGIVLGHSNTFGKGGAGTPSLLQREGERRGFAVRIEETLRIGGERVTSSAIRDHLANGRVGPAAIMLGHTYSLCGVVRRGRQIGGSKLGFPTINVATEDGLLLPKYGVYAGWADVGGYAHPCVINLGVKPTIGQNDLTLEAFLLNFRGNLYDQQANIRFFQYLRGERGFANLDGLRVQIREDVAAARKALGLP